MFCVMLPKVFMFFKSLICIYQQSPYNILLLLRYFLHLFYGIYLFFQKFQILCLQTSIMENIINFIKVRYSLAKKYKIQNFYIL